MSALQGLHDITRNRHMAVVISACCKSLHCQHLLSMPLLWHSAVALKQCLLEWMETSSCMLCLHSNRLTWNTEHCTRVTLAIAIAWHAKHVYLWQLDGRHTTPTQRQRAKLEGTAWLTTTCKRSKRWWKCQVLASKWHDRTLCIIATQWSKQGKN